MKKMILVCAIVCAGQLYGMEAQNIGDLPTDIHNELIKAAVATSNNLDDTIKAIEFASALKGIQYNTLKKFTTLMNILAKKFPSISRKEIAQKFNTKTAEEYVKLGEQLFFPANVQFIQQRDKKRSPVEDIKELLEKGTDPNYSGGQNGSKVLSEVYLQILNNNKTSGPKYENGIAILKLLLNAGAKPNPDHMLNEQKRVDKGTSPADLRRELFNLLKQYADK